MLSVPFEEKKKDFFYIIGPWAGSWNLGDVNTCRKVARDSRGNAKWIND